MDGWKMTSPFGMAYFQGLLISGRVCDWKLRTSYNLTSLFCSSTYRKWTQQKHLGVSKNRGTPKRMVKILVPNPIKIPWIWGVFGPTPIFGSTPTWWTKLDRELLTPLWHFGADLQHQLCGSHIAHLAATPRVVRRSNQCRCLWYDTGSSSCVLTPLIYLKGWISCNGGSCYSINSLSWFQALFVNNIISMQNLSIKWLSCQQLTKNQQGLKVQQRSQVHP